MTCPGKRFTDRLMMMLLFNNVLESKPIIAGWWFILDAFRVDLLLEKLRGVPTFTPATVVIILGLS